MLRFTIVQICGLILALILCYLTNKHKRIIASNTVAYNICLAFCIFSLTFDILSVFAIVNADILGNFITNFICKTYIASLVCTSFSAFNYLMLDVWLDGNKKLRIYTETILAAFIVLIYCAPIYRYYDSEQLYTYGPSTIITYIGSITYILGTIIASYTFKNTINESRKKSLRIWMGIWLASAIIQYFNPELLLVGFASAVGLLTLYGELENPITYIDTESNLFNLKAAKSYANSKLKNGKSIYGFCVKLDTLSKNLTSKDTRELTIKVAKFFEKINKYSFRIDTYTFILLTDKNDLEQIFMEAKSFLKELTSDPKYEGIKVSFAVVEDDNVFEKLDDIINSYYFFKRDVEAETIVITKDTLAKTKEYELMKQKIQKAIDEKRVEVFYQPIYNTQFKRFNSAEALIRIKNEKGEIVSPFRFIPAAEESGLIVPLGESVFKQVCKLLAEKKLDEFGLDYIEVNLSVKQLQRPDLYERFTDIMSKYRINPSQLNFEITESMHLDTEESVMNVINQFRHIGIDFSLDDFGTGHSNIDSMASVPVKLIKFDKTLTQKYFEDERTKTILKHLIPMIKDMGYEIVCEGIETKEQLGEMKSMKVEHIQGYYFSKPIDKDEFVDFIKRSNREFRKA